MTETVQTIPLDEIIPGGLIRFTVMGGVQYLSIRDLIMYACDATADYAGHIWRNIPFSCKSEIQDSLSSFQFPGRGQSDQPVITFPGAIKLSMFFPGKKAKKNRSVMASIIVRYFAGDKTLIEEITANAMSDHPVAQMARDSLKDEQSLQPADPEEIRLKRKREELKLMHDEVEFYSNIIKHDVLDDYGKRVFKESVLNLHTKETMELQRQKQKDDIEHALALLDVENQKRTAEQEYLKEQKKNDMEHALAMLGVENERRAAEQDHAKMLLDIANQKQPVEGVKVKEQWQCASKDFPEIHNRDITSGKDYVSSLLHGQMDSEMIQHTYASLIYRLKRYNPNIHVIKRDSRIFFKHKDLPAIQRVLSEMIGM